MNAIEKIFRHTVVPAALQAADPARALEAHLSHLPDEPRPLSLLAVGKASQAMAAAALQHAGDRVQQGLVITPPGQPDLLSHWQARVRTLPADHPIPSARNLLAARAVIELASHLQSNARFVVLVSGGGSAQLSAPREPLKLEHIATITDALLRSGAAIDAINCVRKHCEQIKGGQLARLAFPTPTTAFVLSDVLGDPLDVIASGPLAPDPTTFAEALEVLHRFGLADEHPEVSALLSRGSAGELEETPKPGDPLFRHVEHVVIANNEQATRAAADALRRAALRVLDVQLGVQGEAKAIGTRLAQAVRRLPPGSAIVWGGETTVRVGKAPGKGGRNQELALAASMVLSGQAGTGLLSLATDGVDGPTDAAGGWVDSGSVERMRRAGIDPADALHRHDSYAALSACGGLLRLGPTGTNVNDVMVGLRLA